MAYCALCFICHGRANGTAKKQRRPRPLSALWQAVIEDPSVDRHHWIPHAEGGREQAPMAPSCFEARSSVARTLTRTRNAAEIRQMKASVSPVTNIASHPSGKPTGRRTA